MSRNLLSGQVLRRHQLAAFSSAQLVNVFLTFSLGVLVGCSSGGGSGGTQSGGSNGANFGCDGSCQTQNLSKEEVSKVIQQAVFATQKLGTAGTFAVVDRVGNVLALYQMDGANTTTTVNGQIGAVGGLEGITLPSTLAAISKAGTGAYLSSQGNAFSTRTASQIVQENFLPQEEFKPGGPLFGVQFSQLLCSDVTVLNPAFSGGLRSGSKPAFGGSIGPRPLPLGLSADPGGLPLYKNGDLVGGIGVEFDGLYTLDRVITDSDDDPEERVALTASVGFEAPAEKTGDNIFVGGRSLRFADISYDQLELPTEDLAPLVEGSFKSEAFYTDGSVREGVPFGDPASGIALTVRAGIPAAILVNGAGSPRFPTRSGRALASGNQLTAEEVDALLDSGLATANRARAAIRTPRDTAVRVSMWITDTDGNPLGFIRSQDAPVFGIDVSLQKARGAVLLSSRDAGALFAKANAKFGASIIEDYATAYSNFTGGQSLDGSVAFSARAIGNLARPFFLDGINGKPNGPLSLPFPGTSTGRSWSPFNTGLQLDLVLLGLAQPLGIPANPPQAIPDNCADSQIFGGRIRNGIQIFAGGVPLYKNGELVGGFGVSGDGIDQDDMVAFYGASRRGLEFIGRSDLGDPDLGFNAPREIRSDKLVIPQPDSSLRYVSCPEAPFSGSNNQNVCEDL